MSPRWHSTPTQSDSDDLQFATPRVPSIDSINHAANPIYFGKIITPTSLWTVKNDQPSNTARLIARCTILASKDPELSKLIPEGSTKTLQQILSNDLFCKGLQFGFFRRMLKLGEHLLLPGIIAHYLTRKIHIEQEVESAIAAGCRQVVMIGAGYDTMAWRLHQKHPDVRFVEIDHPATQKLKSSRLSYRQNLIFEAMDLERDLPIPGTVQCPSGTVFIIEGVTMYLRAEQVSGLLQTVASQAGQNGKVIWTVMERDEQDGLGFRGQSSLVSRWLKFRSEPFRWGLSRDQINDFSAGCHLQTEQTVDHQMMRERFLNRFGLQESPLAQGELICTSTPIPA